jgi:hypothetical protein
VRKRDRGVCRACGLDTSALRRKVRGRGRAKHLRELGFQPRRSLWELDHVVPLIDGGSHDPANLQTLCVPCHRKKSAHETRERARARAAAEPQQEQSTDLTLETLLARADAANERAEALLEGALAPRRENVDSAGDPRPSDRSEAQAYSRTPKPSGGRRSRRFGASGVRSSYCRPE